MITVTGPVYIQLQPNEELAAQLTQLAADINLVKDILMATQSELAAGLTGVTNTLEAAGATLAKIATETDGLQATIAELRAALEAAGGTTPEVDAALQAVIDKAAAIAAAALAVDEKVPDA